MAVELQLGELDFERSTNQFLEEYGRESMAGAFHFAAKCLENQDFAGYEHYFQIYVRLARRSGMAKQLSTCHREITVQAYNNELSD